jgi:hypothetical protein
MLNWLKIIVFSFTLLPLFSEAQSFYAIRRNRNFMVNAGSGIAYYQGDMVDPKELGILKPNIAIGAEYYFLPRISARAGLTWFQIAGNDAKANDDRVERNLHFRSSSVEFSATGAISLIPTGQRFYQRARINLHAFAGIGLLYFNPKAEYQGKWVALAPLHTEGKKYSRIQPVIPFGLGARIKIDPFFNILIEGGYRKTFTDYLDDASSKRYTLRTELKSDLAVALSDRRADYFTAQGKEVPGYVTDPVKATKIGRRGNPENDDGYFIGNITIQYFLPTEIFRSSQRKLYNSKRKAIYRRKRP